MTVKEKTPIMKTLSTNIGYIVGILGFAGVCGAYAGVFAWAIVETFIQMI